MLEALAAWVVAGVTAAGGLPTLPEAFGRGTPGAGGVAQGTGLLRIDIDASRYPEARCADGSGAVIYARRARTEAHRDDWIVYLQGGGSCDSGEDCHARWLGRDGNFGANKLSSRFAPAGGIAAGGLANPDARNPFGGWNHVFVYYCSSDGWAGTAAGVATSAVHEGVAVAYRLDLLGARIVDAVFDTLRGGAAYADPAGRRVPMPSLDEARTVLFAGSSAGGSGARTHADRVGALLRATNRRCTAARCDLAYAAVIDASYGLASEPLDHEGSRACGSALADACTYETAMRRRWLGVVRDFRRGVADESCVAHHAASGDEWRCADGAHVLQHHVATPFFVRADLQDALVMGNTVEAGYRYEGVPLDRHLYGRLEEIQLLELASLAARSEEPRAAGPLEPPGVFGPQCGDHETLRTNDATFGRAIVANGVRHTLPQVLARWLAGAGTTSVVETYDPAGPPRSCAAGAD